MARKSIVYVDGFNLYYGSLKSGPYKWLNLEKYFSLLRPHDDIRQVHYFTALIDGPYRANQIAYLKALGTLPNTRVHTGRYKKKNVKCGVASCNHAATRWFPVAEEKRTDVNIAIQMLSDAIDNLCDNLILVSGDSDLVPALDAVKGRFPNKKLIVYIPSRNPVRGAAVELRSAAHSHRTLPLGPLKAAQFPATMKDRSGAPLQKPQSWL